jgi:hypothetical protein
MKPKEANSVTRLDRMVPPESLPEIPPADQVRLLFEAQRWQRSHLVRPALDAADEQRKLRQ